jgi:hypothetical protein
MKIPSEIDWGDWRADVDQRYAHDLYIGKSNEEMAEHFLLGPIEVFDELLFIAKVPFQYYVMGFRDSVLSKDHSYSFISSQAATSFIGLLEARARDKIDDIAEIESDLMPSAKYIADNQEEFGVDIEIDGDMRIIVENIQQALTAAKSKLPK